MNKSEARSGLRRVLLRNRKDCKQWNSYMIYIVLSLSYWVPLFVINAYILRLLRKGNLCYIPKSLARSLRDLRLLLRICALFPTVIIFGWVSFPPYLFKVPLNSF